MPKLLLQQHCCFTKHPWKTGCFQNTFFYSYILVCFKTTGYWPLDERCAHQSRTGWWCQSCRNVCHAKAETLAASCHISAWRAVSTNINGTQIISLSEFCHPAHWTHHWQLWSVKCTPLPYDRKTTCMWIVQQHMRSHPGSEHSQGMLSVPHSSGFNSPDEAKCLWHKRRRFPTTDWPIQPLLEFANMMTLSRFRFLRFAIRSGRMASRVDRWLLGLVASMACHEFALRSLWVSAMPFETFPILALKSTTSTWTGKKLEVMLLTSSMVVETASGTFQQIHMARNWCMAVKRSVHRTGRKVFFAKPNFARLPEHRCHLAWTPSCRWRRCNGESLHCLAIVAVQSFQLGYKTLSCTCCIGETFQSCEPSKAKTHCTTAQSCHLISHPFPCPASKTTKGPLWCKSRWLLEGVSKLSVSTSGSISTALMLSKVELQGESRLLPSYKVIL